MEQIFIDLKTDLNKIRDFGLVRSPLGPPGKAISLIFPRENTDFYMLAFCASDPFGAPLGAYLGGLLGAFLAEKSS